MNTTKSLRDTAYDAFCAIYIESMRKSHTAQQAAIEAARARWLEADAASDALMNEEIAATCAEFTVALGSIDTDFENVSNMYHNAFAAEDRKFKEAKIALEETHRRSLHQAHELSTLQKTMATEIAVTRQSEVTEGDQLADAFLRSEHQTRRAKADVDYKEAASASNSLYNQGMNKANKERAEAIAALRTAYEEAQAKHQAARAAIPESIRKTAESLAALARQKHRDRQQANSDAHRAAQQELKLHFGEELRIRVKAFLQLEEALDNFCTVTALVTAQQ
ncbi:MAG: hypothetical protein P4L53_08915 [Candidatus Obscuribacterales bacterium]|nr:hypothetical protein [Candidatus Obscuribacterales bacterium]